MEVKFKESVIHPNLRGVFTLSEKENYLNGCCHIFALALAEMTGLKIAALVETRAVFNNEDGTKSSIPMYYYNPSKKCREYDDVGEGLVHAVCLLDDQSDIIFDAKGIRNVSQLDNEYEIRLDTYLKIFDDPNEILVYGHTLGARDSDVEVYVSKTKDYINTYLADDLQMLKEKYGTRST